MNGYANLSETLNQNISSTLFSIDAEYYQVRNRGKYTRYFENELMELPHKAKQKKHLGSIFFFEFGKFKNVCLNLPEKA
jgi:hypothetical protein